MGVAQKTIVQLITIKNKIDGLRKGPPLKDIYKEADSFPAVVEVDVRGAMPRFFCLRAYFELRCIMYRQYI